MENNYSYPSYPDSGDSSPRSREIEFENPSPWEDQQQQQPSPTTYKVKFMCSYGGKIHPRPHDNQLSYVGGETKILAVDRNIKFSALVAKLPTLCDAEVFFKYQLPGEDLDALISVTNDDDLEHMMHEYDRLYRASPKPARLRLFLFPVNPPPVAPTQSVGSNERKSERERFVDALNSSRNQSSPPPPQTVGPATDVDFFFGLEKGMPPPVAAKVRDPLTDSAVPETEVTDDRAIGSDPIQKHIQDLQRLRIGEEHAMYRRKSDDNLAACFAGDFYVQKMPEKVSPTALPGTVTGTVPVPAGYWSENQIATGVFPANTMGADQAVYMIPAPANMYHAPPIGRPMTGPTGQGYYAVQRMPPEVYRDQPVYNVVPPPQSPAAQPTVPPPKMAYSEGIGVVRSTTPGVADTGYAQVAYDSGVGRQVYYTAQGGVVPQQPPSAQYQAMAAVGAFSTDMRPAATFNQEGSKVVAAKVSQTTA